MLKKLLTLFLMAACLAPAARPQFLTQDGDQHPPSTRWKVITTPHFEVIVPEDIVGIGQRAARLAELSCGPLGKTLETNLVRIALVLTNQGVVANGLARLAPRMTEWLTTPPQSGLGGATDWLILLAAHEGRHVVQFDKLNTGFSRFMGSLYGELGRWAFSLLASSAWYMEGDAVAAETALTGVARLPEFDMSIRALLLSGRTYPYDKAFLRSFKDWYPDFYRLGYLMTTHLRREMGGTIWSRVLDRASGYSFYVFAFSQALRAETGRNVTGLYEETMNELRTLWQKQLEGLTLTPVRTIPTKPKAFWTNYFQAQSQPDGSIICQKYGMDDAPSLVRVRTDGREELLRRISPLRLYATTTSARAGKVAWCEVEPDLRWGKRNYGTIVVHDLRTGALRRLTRGSRFLNVALSPDGKRMAAVEFSTDSVCRLVILEADSGKRLAVVPNPDNAYLLTPAWSEDGRRVVFIKQSERGLAIGLADVDAGTSSEASSYSPEAVSEPVFFGRYILYHSPYSGIDNIYALDTQSGERWQVTSVRFGAFYPEVGADGKHLIFSNYTIKGYDLAEIALDPAAWTRLEDVERRDIKYFEPLIGQEQGGNIFGAPDPAPQDYPVADYSPSSHLLNVHSWGLVPTTTEANLLFLSNDLLNKASFIGKADWNYNEKTLGFGVSGSYQALFPILDLKADYGGRSSTFEDAAGGKQYYGWRETALSLGIRLPFNLSRGATTASLSLGAEIAYLQILGRDHAEAFDQGNGILMPVSYSLDFSRYQSGSARDLNPPWGQHLAVEYRHTPFQTGDFRGRLFYVEADAFFPGLAPHHSLSIGAAHEDQSPDNYRFESALSFPRGYDYVYHQRLTKLSVDYALPLAYPDAALGAFLYLKRVSANLFYSYGQGVDGSSKTDYRSAGLDLVLDLNFFRLPATVRCGLRLAYRFTDRSVRFIPLILGLTY